MRPKDQSVGVNKWIAVKIRPWIGSLLIKPTRAPDWLQGRAKTFKYQAAILNKRKSPIAIIPIIIIIMTKVIWCFWFCHSVHLPGYQEPTVKSVCSEVDATGLYSNILGLILRNFALLLFLVLDSRRQHGQVVRALDLKSGDTGFQFCSDHQLDLFQLVPGSTLRLCLYMANWSASCQLGFLTC